MRKINLSDYMVKATVEGQPKEVPFKVKDSLIELLFFPGLKLNATSLLKQEDLARKIESAGESAIFEEGEYERILRSISLFENFDRHAVELVKRIMSAEKVDVTEKA